MEKLNKIAATPEGILVQTMAPLFGGVEGMAPMLKPFLASFGEELLEVMVERVDLSAHVHIIISEVDRLLSEKLLLITPVMVKELLEEVIRVHLGWLVVWGNVFGGIIGLISHTAGVS